jgi:adenosine deaminase
MDPWSEKFQAALEGADLDALRLCTKSDLHNHGILGGSRAIVKQLTGHDVEPLNRKLVSMDQMHAWVDANIGRLFEGARGRLLGIKAAFGQARRDGVIRLGIGEDVWAITLYQGRAQQLTRGLQSLHREIAPDIEWIPQLGLSRHCSSADLERWAASFLELDFYRAIDLSGDEFAQPIGAFKALFRSARAAGLRLKAHVGEWGTADDIWRAVEELELDEVQHGIVAVQSLRVMRLLADNRIRVNVCPTSNVMLGRVAGLKVHPIRELYDAGVLVTVNTDGVLVFGQGVSEEFLSLYQARLFSAGELDEIRRNGLRDAPASSPVDKPVAPI